MYIEHICYTFYYKYVDYSINLVLPSVYICIQGTLFSKIIIIVTKACSKSNSSVYFKGTKVIIILENSVLCIQRYTLGSTELIL